MPADLSGNWCADIADMAGHEQLAAWLRAECSAERARSCALLGLPPHTTDERVIRAAYLACARRLHPDRQCEGAGGEAAGEGVDGEGEGGGGGREGVGGIECSRREQFERVCAAYNHLTLEGGRGHQSNPSHSLFKMLRLVSPPTGEAEASEGEKEAFYFKARLVATVHDYAEHGLPIGSLRRKFSQVTG